MNKSPPLTKTIVRASRASIETTTSSSSSTTTTTTTTTIVNT